VAKKQRISPFLKRHFPQVEKVINARKGIRVVVKKRDCGVESKSGQPTECALARATRREYKADGVVIGMSASYIIKGKKAVRFETSEAIGRELTSFDRHHDFAPGIYRLSPVPRSRAEPARRNSNGSPTGGTHPHRIVHKSTARVRTLK